MDFTIDPISTGHDKDFFIRLEFESAKENRAVDTSRPEDEVFAEHRQELLSFIDGKAKTGIFIAKKAETPMGFIWVSERGQMEPWDLETPPAWIYDIAVSKEFRGQGAGKLLLRHAEQWAQAEGFTRIGLHVFGFNEIARHLYQASNYTLLNAYYQKETEKTPSPIDPDSNGFRLRRAKSETDRQYIYDLGYRRFVTSATAYSPVEQSVLTDKYHSQWQAISMDKPTEFTCLAERAGGALAGFAWAYQSKGDIGDQKYAWVRNIESDPTYEESQTLIRQLLARVEKWATQNGLNIIRLGAHHTQTNLIEILRQKNYHETNLFMQKRF